MAEGEILFGLSKRAAALVRSGKAFVAKGGIHDVETGRIIENAIPITDLSQKGSKAVNAAGGGASNMTSAIGWVNVVLELVNIGVSVVGFYLVLSRMTSIQGEIHKLIREIDQFAAQYQEDKESEKLKEYKTHMMNMQSHLGFLQNRYSFPEYDKKVFMNREPDIEREINETAAFLENVLSIYQKGSIPDRLACQIIFTLAPVFARFVNEYCCQYYSEHGRQHQQFAAWKSILELINSDQFRTFMKKEMAFSIDYVELSPERRKEVIDSAFGCIQELIVNLDKCAEAIKLAPDGALKPVEEIQSEQFWERIRDQIRTEPGETLDEAVTRQIREIDINDDGEEEVIIHLKRA